MTRSSSSTSGKPASRGGSTPASPAPGPSASNGEPPKGASERGKWQRLGNPSPWHPLDLHWDEMPDTAGVPRDRDARPSLDAVLELRRDRMSTVRQVIEGLTDASLDGHTEPVEGPGWPQDAATQRESACLCILNEEWEHRLYAERDLGALEARGA